ncbi:hypothetical protein B1H19_17345 [Streptomyces gilvosporeus]|uniref:Uncharacterized protein n=1 Tax=Streptomyces gilvosporeus TaxID=553510 RepID=A0A1V0TRX2_9ACTN|nr:hypothetical protein B1H19_17345 [Streptomyces gilvosporeus]
MAQSVVTARLAAGAQIIGPVTSVFWHHGEFGTGMNGSSCSRPVAAVGGDDHRTGLDALTRQAPALSSTSDHWQFAVALSYRTVGTRR